MCPNSFFSLLVSLCQASNVRFLLGAFFRQNTGKKLSFCCPKRIFIYFILYSYMRCRYLSGFKNTKAPVSLRFITLEETIY